MAHVLHIQVSPRGEDSFSIRVARAFLEAYAEAHAEDTIETLDLPAHAPPAFLGDAAGAKMHTLGGQGLPDKEARVWEGIVEAVNHLKRADKLVISSPMWNFGVPYHLKHYIDVIVQPQETFRYTESGEVEGLLAGRPALLILARGGRYGPGTSGEAMDYQLPYLRAVLRFIGLEKIDTVLVEPTVAEGPDAAARALDAAIATVRKKARTF
ncbi:MAG TPA: NAD(P)H-dependent oxidoreductase [Phycisphaerae bacterium]|nr:NAD(P)H-dependent oxidoreductase [Phycisphaerae bacterium]